MTEVDISIIEYLLNEGNRELIANPKVIAVNIDYSPNTVREHMRPLRETKLVEYYDESDGLYQISNRGRRYISGELSDEEVEEIESILDS
jgi:DNA-binding transcriptional ArsR family regulator